MSDTIIASFEIDKIGPKGDPGPGIATGGTASQVLAKIDSTNFNTHWITNNVTGAAGGVLSGTYPNPGFDGSALTTMGAASQGDLTALQSIVSNLTFASIAGTLADAQLPPDLALADPGFDAVAIFTEGTGLITLAKVDTSRISAMDTDGTLAANSDTKIASQKATKTYADTKVTGALDTDGTLAANSDVKVASQKATKTYADTKVTGSLDTDGTLAANSDTHVASQKATKTYVDAHATAAHGVYSSGSPPTVDVGPFIISITGAKFGQDGDTNTHVVFTVPTSRTFIFTGAEFQITSFSGAAAGTVTWKIEDGSGNALSATTASLSFTPNGSPSTQTLVKQSITDGSLISRNIPAAGTLNYHVTALQGSTTCTGTVFVRGYYCA